MAPAKSADDGGSVRVQSGLLVACVAVFALECGHGNSKYVTQPTLPSSVPTMRNDGTLDLASVLEPLRKKHAFPALAGAIVTDEKILALGVVGVRKFGENTPAELEDPFHLGSDTKAMTAILVAEAIEKGKLAWTSTVGEILADVPMLDAYKAVTVEQLLAHRGGFSHDPRAKSVSDIRRLPGTVAEQRAAYVRIALAEPPEAAPGTKQIYSNAGYVMAAAMAERVLGDAYESLVEKNIFAPLDMRGVGFGAMGSPEKTSVIAPWQHRVHDGDHTPIEPGPFADNPVAMAPAGGLHMPMRAWATFIREELRGANGEGTLLQPSTYAILNARHFDDGYFAGWLQVERGWAGGPALTHSGSNTQNYALAWLAPKNKIAFLVATNQADDDKTTFKGCDEIIGALIKLAQARGWISRLP